MEELIDALENRLEHGESKESLRAEVLAAGHSNEVFEEAFLEATQRYQMSGGGEDSEVSFADTVVEEVTTIPHTRAKGDLYTLTIGRPHHASGLIGYIEMLKTGWHIGIECIPLLKGLLGALIILFGSLAFVVLLIGAYVSSDLFVDNNVALVTLVVLFTCGYIGVILYAGIAGFAFFRGMLLRENGIDFWQHFWWGWRHMIPIFLLSFYIQIITQAGFVLFVIPGFVAMVYLGYAQYVLAAHTTRGFDAMIRSFELVYGRFWAIVGRKLFLIVAIFTLVLIDATLLTVFPLLGIIGAILLLVVLYFMLSSSVALFESVAAAKPIHIFSTHDKLKIKKWLWVVVGVGILFGTISFLSMISTIDVGKEYPEVEKFVHLVRDAQENKNNQIETTDTEDTNAAQITLITTYIDQIPDTANVYKDNNGSFAGVCSYEAGVNTFLRYAYDSGSNDIFCHDSHGWYIAEAELGDSGSYYCVDSAGNSLIQQHSRNGYETCLDDLKEE